MSSNSTCPTCGQPVRTSVSEDGTGCFVPIKPPTVSEIRIAAVDYATEQCKNSEYDAAKMYAKKDFIAGAEYILQQLKTLKHGKD